MIGLDANVLVRYIVQDHRQQSGAAARLVESQCSVDNPGWIDTIVLCELVWVLESAYGYSRNIIADVLRQLLGTAELVPDNPSQAWCALRAYESGAADFSDYLIGVRKHDNGCEATYTFDKRVTGSDWHPALEESQ